MCYLDFIKLLSGRPRKTAAHGANAMKNQLGPLASSQLAGQTQNATGTCTALVQ